MAYRLGIRRVAACTAAVVLGGSVVWAAEADVVPPPPPAPPPRNDNPRTTAAGFDPEALERGAKALREIKDSPHAKRVFETMKKQEETRQAEEKARQAEFNAIQAHNETERARVMAEEQRKTIQQQASTKAQLARYEDELARKRLQFEHEQNRVRNAELVKMQEEAAKRQEVARAAAEEAVQEQRRQTERVRAQADADAAKAKAMAEAEARAHEARLTEDVTRRLMLDRAAAQRDTWLAAIGSTFEHLGGGIRSLLTDKDKLVVAVGGATALAAGIYSTREGSRVMWRHIDRLLGQPSLVRESSMGKYPWSRFFRRGASSSSASSAAPPSIAGSAAVGGEAATAGAVPGESLTAKMRAGRGFGDVILHPSLHARIRQLAAATANTKSHGAPFRNMLFYGPPGTGKTMAAKELARQSGLEYALMTGGDVAPLGAQAVTKIHQLFDWAAKTRKGLLLFIDEADAFLCERNKTTMSEAQRSALNALLFRTGDQSRDVVLVLATNRPGDLDAAIADRMDEALEFPPPGEAERAQLLALYLHKYVVVGSAPPPSWAGWLRSLFRGPQERIEVRGVTADVIKEAAAKTEGFSGREIAKLLASVQGAVYGSAEAVLTADLFREVVDYKVAEHRQRRLIAAQGSS